jgi:hypothetical protein
MRTELDFSHEIPQKFSSLPLLGAIFLKCATPNLKSWIRPWYISLSWFDIPELVVPILDRELLLTMKLLKQEFLVVKLKSSV